MRRSKLEIALDILKILAQKGPMKLTHMMFKANVNCDVLKKNVELLLKPGLIEERLVGRDRMVYAITHQGLTLSKGWKELQLCFRRLNSKASRSPFLETRFRLELKFNNLLKIDLLKTRTKINS